MLLANRRHLALGALGRPPDSIDGHYFSADGKKLVYGKCYLQEDVEVMFRRVKAAPPLPPAEAPPAGRATVEPKTRPQTGPFTTAVDEEYSPAGCVRVAGRPVYPVSKNTWKLLRVLAEARAKGAGVEKSELEAIDANPLATLRRFMQRCPADTPTIHFPGGKGKGGYRLL
jgi:hypothetical protein